MTSIGKYRHLSRCTTAAGHFVILAIDHRANLLELLNQHAPEPLTDEEFTDFKQQVMEPLLPGTTAVLTDPVYGIGKGIAQRIIGGACGLIAPIEVTNYDLHPSKREIKFLPDWSVAKIKRMGGDGVKLLLPYHPDSDNAAIKHDHISRIVEECTRLDIPFFLEPIAFSLDPDKKLSNPELRQVMVTMVKTFTDLGVDVLKIQFPVDAKQSNDEEEWLDACEEVNAACGVPWALLSAGVDYPTYERQTLIACQAGASGVIVGRALWAEAVQYQGDDRQRFVAETAVQRLRILGRICNDYAQPWYSRVDPPAHDAGWYATYNDLI